MFLLRPMILPRPQLGRARAVLRPRARLGGRAMQVPAGGLAGWRATHPWSISGPGRLPSSSVVGAVRRARPSPCSQLTPRLGPGCILARPCPRFGGEPTMEKDREQLVADLERLVGAPTVSGWLQHMAGRNDEGDWERLAQVRVELGWWHEVENGLEHIRRKYKPLCEPALKAGDVERDDVRSRWDYRVRQIWLEVRAGSKTLRFPQPFDAAEPYENYMRTLARFATKESRKASRRGNPSPRSGVRLALIGDDDQALVDDKTQLKPLDALERDEVVTLAVLDLDHALRRLPPDQSIVVLMRWSTMLESHQFLASKVIAKVLGKSSNSIDQLYSDAKKKLKTMGIDLDAADAVCRGMI